MKNDMLIKEYNELCTLLIKNGRSLGSIKHHSGISSTTFEKIRYSKNPVTISYSTARNLQNFISKFKSSCPNDELKNTINAVLLENIDKIASAVTSKLKHKLMDKDRTRFIRNEHRLQFVNEYLPLCELAYGTKYKSIELRNAKKPLGKSVVALAREYLGYKPTTYDGDIYRSIGMTYYKSINQWPY